eukprot:TRINITY_DN89985_c0_g1_i1.p1 TRINITY_DN89985_c0_g1~~TRINITY_DN89985_c0_g1_i1.p1  ORF type:complete len:282 (+),score=50.93 TRINITY_DN89985_c0_g1_i1:87-932(+)
MQGPPNQGLPQQLPDHDIKVNAFRSFCVQIMTQVTEQLCVEFEREVRQLSEDVIRYRGELARCADLLAFQLGQEKQYHNMLSNIAGNTSVLAGRVSEVGQKHSSQEQVKQQMHDLLEQMFHGGKGALAESFGGIEEHRQMAETHLMTSSQLQNQSEAVRKELDNILSTLQLPPVTYREAPPVVVPGPGQTPPATPPGRGMQQQQFRPPTMNGGPPMMQMPPFGSSMQLQVPPLSPGRGGMNNSPCMFNQSPQRMPPGGPPFSGPGGNNPVFRPMLPNQSMA